MSQGGSPDAITILTTLYGSLSGLTALVTAISYMSGFIMIVRALMKLKSFGQHSGMMGGRGEMTEPLVLLTIGSILLYLPTALGISFQTIFQQAYTTGLLVTPGEQSSMQAYASTLAYDPAGNNSQKVETIMNVILGYTKFIGLVAFIRGWHILSHIGSGQSQPGNLSKGIVHLVGGILAMNALEFINVLASTLGYPPLF